MGGCLRQEVLGAELGLVPVQTSRDYSGHPPGCPLRLIPICMEAVPTTAIALFVGAQQGLWSHPHGGCSICQGISPSPLVYTVAIQIHLLIP